MKKTHEHIYKQANILYKHVKILFQNIYDNLMLTNRDFQLKQYYHARAVGHVFQCKIHIYQIFKSGAIFK